MRKGHASSWPVNVKSGWLIRTRQRLRERRLLPLRLEEQPQADLVQNSWTIRLSIPGGVRRGGQAAEAEAKAEGDALLFKSQSQARQHKLCGVSIHLTLFLIPNLSQAK